MRKDVYIALSLLQNIENRWRGFVYVCTYVSSSRIEIAMQLEV